MVEKPDTCPSCGKGISPIIKDSVIIPSHNVLNLYVALQCPVCNAVFFAGYYLEDYPIGKLYPSFVYPSSEAKMPFPDEINSISPSFVRIYNEAYLAEQAGAKEITGPGYRMALEFLVKDYAVKFNPNDKDKIENMLLGQCIEKYAPAADKTIIGKTAWIGNDATHYCWKHKDMDLRDLKNLIDICLYAFEIDIKKRSYDEKIKPE